MSPELKIVILLFILVQISCDSSLGSQDDASWSVLATNYPEMRGEYAMAYDTLNKKIIAFGGRTGFRSDFQNVDETWTFDYSVPSWTKLEPSNAPPWRTNHTMTYDPKRHKTLLFGGNDFNQVFNDLWEFDYRQNEWTNLSPSNPPEARQMHGMTYVPEQDVLVLFGGRRLDGGAAFNDLWMYDYALNEWKELNPSNSPPNQDHVNLAYHTSENLLILYTGAEENRTPRTWAYNFESNNWRDLRTINIPEGDHTSLVYDEIGENLILFGSKPSSRSMRTWKFDYSENSWQDITPWLMPGEYIEHDAMVYLSNYDVFIQYGGCCSDNTMELKISR